MINEFKCLFNKNTFAINNDIVVGLSGGSDSTFLLHYIWNLKKKFRFVKAVYPVIVDHGLRKESYDEALQAKNISAELGFNSKIIKIKDKYTSGNLQNWARIRRRNILYQIAKKYSADIVLGHQYDDHIETIFMRLLRSSGFDGLTGIKEVTNWKDVKVLRPLLKVKKKEILDFLTRNKITYVNDKSNINTKFERVKSRKIIRLIEKNKFFNIQNNLYKLSIVSKRLVNCINKFENIWKNENVFFYSYGSISIDYENFYLLFKKNKLFSSYILGKLIRNVGGKNFLPRKINLINNLNIFFNDKLNKFTINNVIIFKKSKKINLIRENRNIQYGQKIIKNKIFFFDNRFIILSNFNGKLAPNNDKSNLIIDLNNYELMRKSYNYINYTIPKLQTLEGRLINPYLYMIDYKNINSNLKNKTDFDLIFIKGKSEIYEKFQ